MSILIFVVGEQCLVVGSRSEISDQLASKGTFYEVESLPEGEGILRRAEGGSFYYEPFPSVEPTEPEPLPVESVQPQPVESIEDKLARMEQQLQEQQMQNLILVDINLTVYEELLTVKDQLLMLTGATDNA